MRRSHSNPDLISPYNRIALKFQHEDKLRAKNTFIMQYLDKICNQLINNLECNVFVSHGNAKLLNLQRNNKFAILLKNKSKNELYNKLKLAITKKQTENINSYIYINGYLPNSIIVIDLDFN